MNTLRLEASSFLVLCMMILALPMIQPVATALAEQAGFAGVLCSQAGEAPDKPSHDHCPCVAICGCMHCTPVSSGIAPEPGLAGLPVIVEQQRQALRPVPPLAPYRLPRGTPIRAPPFSA